MNPLQLASRAAIAAVLLQRLLPYLLPHGPAVVVPPEHQPACSDVDPANDSLRVSRGKFTKIYERLDDSSEVSPLLRGCETILFDAEGTMYIMNEDSVLVSLTDFRPMADGSPHLTARATEVAHLGVGQPLGGKFDGKGCLYFADPILGLARVCDVSKSSAGKVELLASRVKLPDGTYSPINYADDVDIGPRTGHVYFSDASDIRPDRDPASGSDDGSWDIMYASKLEGMRGARSGRVLRYKPDTGEVDVLATGAAFANGVAVVNAEEEHLIFTSTFEGRVYKIDLTSEGEGVKEIKPEKAVDGFPGYLDGTDCSFDRGRCYVAIPSSHVPALKAIFGLPPGVGAAVRTLLMAIPRTWAPKPEKYGAVAEIFVGTKDGEASRIERVFQDPDGRDTSMITGVTLHGGKLYVGTLHGDHVGVLALD